MIAVTYYEPAKKANAAQRMDVGWEDISLQDDWLIIQEVCEGNREAYAQLVDKYKDRIYGFLHRMTGESQDAQDLTQEVFLKAFCHLGKYKPTDAFLAWLYRMAHNLYIDAWRKNKRYTKAVLEDTILVEHITPETAYLAKEKQDFLQRQILALGEDYRAVFLLKYMEQLSYKEISEIMDVPVTTVQMRIHHAKKKLRAGLGKEMPGGAADYELLPY